MMKVLKCGIIGQNQGNKKLKCHKEIMARIEIDNYLEFIALCNIKVDFSIYR
jgi:hypothetical protein